MAYEHATASSMHDLLDKLRLFLISAGWTVNDYSSDSQMYDAWSGLTATGSYRLHVEKTFGQTGEDIDTGYFNFRSAERLNLFEDRYSNASTINSRYYSEVRGIGINGSTSYSGVANWDQEPGCPENGTGGKSIGACITELPSASAFNYWFFINGDAVIVVCEILSGVVAWMAFGRLLKAGSYTGGLFYAASSCSYYPSNYYWVGYGVGAWLEYRTQFLSANNSVSGAMGVYLDADGVIDWRHMGNEGSSSGEYSNYIYPATFSQYGDINQTSSTQASRMAAYTLRATPNTFNGLCPMMPAYVMMKRASGRWSYLGHIEGLRIINGTNYTLGESFILGDTGGEEWYVFPQHQKGPDADFPAYFLGPESAFAVKKEV